MNYCAICILLLRGLTRRIEREQKTQGHPTQGHPTQRTSIGCFYTSLRWCAPVHRNACLLPSFKEDKVASFDSVPFEATSWIDPMAARLCDENLLHIWCITLVGCLAVACLPHTRKQNSSSSSSLPVMKKESK